MHVGRCFEASGVFCPSVFLRGKHLGFSNSIRKILSCATSTPRQGPGGSFGKIEAIETGTIILTVSGGYQSQKWGCFPITHHLGGDFDHGKTMRPVKLQACTCWLLPGLQ